MGTKHDMQAGVLPLPAPSTHQLQLLLLKAEVGELVQPWLLMLLLLPEAQLAWPMHYAAVRLLLV